VVEGERQRVLAEQHHRHARARDVVGGHRLRADDRAVDHVRPEVGDDLALAGPVALGLLDEHAPVVLGGGRDDPARQLAEVGDRQLGDDERDEAGAPAAQVAGADVGPVPGGVESVLDAAAVLRLHEVVPVDHVRDGLDGHPGQHRDIPQGGHAWFLQRCANDVKAFRRPFTRVAPQTKEEARPMANTPVDEDLWAEFHRVVNMTSRELSEWLRVRSADTETEALPDHAGTETGQRVLAILGKRKTDLNDDDVRVMHKVVDRVHAERRDDLEPTAGEAHWRHRLMTIGHDPLKG
jgi:hypothetical protein